MLFAQVHLDVPIDGPFDYLIGPHHVAKGSIVVVPFRRKKLVGIVESVSDESLVDHRKLKIIESVLLRTVWTGPIFRFAIGCSSRQFFRAI